ncbi:MAG TPA: S41 family peptidase, partial [Roseiflexaceae bacterium]
RPRLCALLACLALALGACTPIPAGSDRLPEPTAASAAAAQPVKLAGTLVYTNDMLTSYHTRHAVALVDLRGFVLRDPALKIPRDSLTFGTLTLDQKHRTGSYQILLPAQPPGSLVHVDHQGERSKGVQVFAVAYWPDPFSDADRHAYGWPADLVSTVDDAENQNEITGGKIVVWAPDDQQQFPSGFGKDRRLFTGDDPLQALPAGYSVANLDAEPFALERAEQPSLPLHEQADTAVKDYSKLSYTAAFQRLFEQLHHEYAFNGIPGKEPPWADLYARIAPAIARAEQQHDARGFYLALRDFASAFHDGHVSLDGGDLGEKIFDERAGGGYGFAIRRLDDGRYVVSYVLRGGPAEQASMRVGAQLTGFDGRPIDQAVAAIQPLDGPHSTDLALRDDQLRYLTRAPIGASAKVTFANPGGPPVTAALTAVDERDSLDAASASPDPTAPPVEYWVLDSGLGYVRINSNDDDLDLIDELFTRALDSFDYHQVRSLIVDLRLNDGGASLDLAGYLTDQAIPLARIEYYSAATGRFEPDGPPEQIEPVTNPYHFEKLAVLVDQGCFSACEIEAYGFSKLPGAIVVGQRPTAGVAAEVSHGQFRLPEDIRLQAPTGRYVLPDGTLFIEGAGVAPTLRVAIDEQTDPR